MAKYAKYMLNIFGFLADFSSFRPAYPAPPCVRPRSFALLLRYAKGELNRLRVQAFVSSISRLLLRLCPPSCLGGNHWVANLGFWKAFMRKASQRRILLASNVSTPSVLIISAVAAPVLRQILTAFLLILSNASASVEEGVVRRRAVLKY